MIFTGRDIVAYIYRFTFLSIVESATKALYFTPPLGVKSFMGLAILKTFSWFSLLRFTCLFGKKFVSKSDFAIGSSANLQADLSAECLISGWFNATVGSYTCVKDCGPPTNYSTVFTNNWDGKLTVVPYGTTFK